MEPSPHPKPETAMADKTATAKPKNKSQTYVELAEATGLNRKQVTQFFDALGQLIQKELGKKGPGVFVVPGLLKLKRVVKPASKATMRPNPFKPGEMMEVKAKPGLDPGQGAGAQVPQGHAKVGRQRPNLAPDSRASRP